MSTKYSNETGNVTYRLKEPNLEKPSRIMGRYSFKNSQVDFSTGLKILPNHWDDKSKTVISGSEKREYNQKLNKFRTSIIDGHSRFNEQFNRLPSKDELKIIVNEAKEGKELTTVQKNKKNFDEIFEEFMGLLNLKNSLSINSGQKPLHKSYTSSFNVAFADLKEFIGYKNYFLDIDKFDETQCLEFQNWLITEKKIKSNTVKTRIKRISQILKRAFEKGYTENRSFMRDEFKVKVSPNINAVLTEEEIAILYDFDFSSNSRLEKIRDLFILGCHTSLRFGDISRIEKAHINYANQTINILLEKVSDTSKYKKANFPFFGYTEEILKKYDSDIKNITISNQNTNEYLKEVFRLIPYFEEKIIVEEKPTNKGVIFTETNFANKISFHDSRRTFCTNRYIDGWDLLEIWQFTGHTNESTFKTYFKPTFEHERIRQENIKLRNERLLRVDLQAKQIEELEKKIKELEASKQDAEKVVLRKI